MDKLEGYWILVLDRGHVVVGEIHPGKSPLAFHHFVSPCRIIRQWGTSEGIAQLKDGPTETTKMDMIGVEITPFRAVIRMIQITKEGEKKWKKHLS